ncbi:MAG: tRNA (N6-isopentenyl adenosine(37)-C2)-methylthiotransferase MiaB [Planctomycetes bacterium GWF2_41_51]|nr:MAG: tRNA (N6-isopentenyl adenosine(37)-C2)-methylthiotransferase MiaB [Planctomycetes bacterium GWF2_41_51]HBG26859.1 tRNA (N6-isopentenyl adenosine(37)-C2)-methylthiotransferase MiaB [Phycisphaerales bacterium]
MKIFLRSFGCQMNKLDSNLVVNSFLQGGFEFTEEVGEADVVLVNTCSVRNHAEERVLSLLGHMKHIRKTNPKLIVAVFGCMAQRLKEDLLNHPVVNIVCGPMQIPELPRLVNGAIENTKKQKAVSENIRQKAESEILSTLDDFEQDFDSVEENLPAQAYVRVMHGCNNFCSYCVVPYVRGPEVSRPAEKIITQIKKLTDAGVKQVTLLGQTVNSYKTEKLSFADLLYAVSKIEGVEWIKFVTCYPRNFDERIFQAIIDLPKVCRYLHIPAQSGSDRILKAMNRGYTCEEYLEIINKAKEIVPDIAVAGDFIVGFPGESDEDFRKSAELIEKAQYKNSYIFKYSPRPGTRADEKLADDVPNEIKKQRNIELLAVQEKISEEINKTFVGKTVKVLVDGTSKKGHLDSANGKELPQLIGRTAGDFIVVFDGPANLAGQFVDVNITRASALTLFGEKK